MKTKIKLIISLLLVSNLAVSIEISSAVKDDLKNCLDQLSSVNKTKGNYCEANVEKVPTEKEMEALCNKPDKTAKNLIASDLQRLSVESEEFKKYLIDMIKKESLDKAKEEALEKRIKAITVNLQICKDSTIHYDILDNNITGCLANNDLTYEQALLMMTHELSHSVDPCSYHGGQSEKSYNPLNFGKVLKYSKPMNYEQSLKEYPFGSMVTCQPARIKEMTLMNQVSEPGWSALCAKFLSLEYFADEVGFKIFNQWTRNQPKALQDKILKQVPHIFCPSKGQVGKMVNGKMVFEEGWMESGTHPTFKERYPLFKKYMKNLSSEDLLEMKGQCVGK